MKKRLLTLTLLLLFSGCLSDKNNFPSDISSSPFSAVCTEDGYGRATVRQQIEQAMAFGTPEAVMEAINLGKEARGTAVGCPVGESFEYYKVSNQPPLLAQVEANWVKHNQQLVQPSHCPRPGRAEPSTALGGYFAQLAGYTVSQEILRTWATHLENQQYSSKYAPIPLVAPGGAFGYYAGSGSCALQGAIGEGIAAISASLPQYVVTYNNGQFAGKQFIIADQDANSGLFDGGMAYDHGWAGVMMVEAAIQETDPAWKAFFAQSARLAGEFSISSFPVRNHNYTAKHIWLLSYLYGWTGEEPYRTALLDKLERGLLPGVLMDQNEDGKVDGMQNTSFSSLAEVSQRSGRMWDGHNALPWYQAINTWAVIEAYAAFRDRGDSEQAYRLKPYAVAMLNNLAWEINERGVGSSGPGFRDVIYAFLTGCYKIAQYEGEAHPDWENALYTLYNTGFLNTYGEQTASTGFMLLYLSGKRYTPLLLR